MQLETECSRTSQLFIFIFKQYVDTSLIFHLTLVLTRHYKWGFCNQPINSLDNMQLENFCFHNFIIKRRHLKKDRYQSKYLSVCYILFDHSTFKLSSICFIKCLINCQPKILLNSFPLTSHQNPIENKIVCRTLRTTLLLFVHIPKQYHSKEPDRKFKY